MVLGCLFEVFVLVFMVSLVLDLVMMFFFVGGLGEIILDVDVDSILMGVN